MNIAGPGQPGQQGVGTPNWFTNQRSKMSAQYGDYGGWNNFLKTMVGSGLGFLPGASDSTAPQAYSGLYDILLNKGHVDPSAMNWQLADIGRNTQNRQMQAAGNAAANLGQGSGVAQALEAAIGQGGAEQRSRVIADEQQKAEERRRSDLELFMRMIMDPNIDLTGIERGVASSRGSSGNAQAVASGVGGLMQGLASMFGGA